jgi:hypothetical protein
VSAIDWGGVGGATYEEAAAVPDEEDGPAAGKDRSRWGVGCICRRSSLSGGDGAVEAGGQGEESVTEKRDGVGGGFGEDRVSPFSIHLQLPTNFPASFVSCTVVPLPTERHDHLSSSRIIWRFVKSFYMMHSPFRKYCCLEGKD